jgi:hypothetical protein
VRDELHAAVGAKLNQLAGMDSEPRARRHLPDLAADQRVDAGRIAACDTAQFGVERFSRLLQRPAGFIAGPDAAGRAGSRHPGRHLALAQEPADDHRLLLQPARGLKEDRQLAPAELGQERPQPLRSAEVELALGGDPFAAARAARVRLAFRRVEDDRRGDGARLRLGFRRGLAGAVGLRGGGAGHRSNDQSATQQGGARENQTADHVAIQLAIARTL